MAQRYKVQRAGNIVRKSLYTMTNPRDTAEARAAKKQAATAARCKMNLKYSWEKCRLKLAANFGTGDLYVTLTYDNEHLPQKRDDANAQLKKWFRTMRKEYERAGAAPLRYIYATEVLTSHGRYHHHLVMNRIPDAIELIAAMWPYGLTDVQYIDERRMVELARYMTKEAVEAGRKVGQRAWTPSKNLAAPDEKTDIVPDGFTLTLPPGCELIENPTTRNAFGEFAYIEYRLPPNHN